MTTATSVEVERLSPTLGARVTGVDLSSELGAAERSELRELLARHQVLVIPGQAIEPGDQVRFASIFGEPRRVSAFFPAHDENPFVEVLEGHGEAIGTDIWHTDLSWQARPAVATCLHAQVLPPLGGDTIWASMTAAYDLLSPAVKQQIEHLEAEHTWEKSIVEYVRAGPDPEARYREQRERFPPVRHRVVQQHPVTGRRILYVNDLFSSVVLGVPRDEGRALLTLLTDMARIPELQMRYRWEPDAVVIWDNRSVQHYAVTDYAPHHRRLHRITIEAPEEAFAATA